MKTFEEWLNEIEGYSLRSERAYTDLVEYEYDSPTERWDIVSDWLKAAFEAGVESQKQEVE
jgi:hypothetical protein